MIIKKFAGKSEEEAVAAAKKELGEGVVIMNVRLVKPKGLLGSFKRKQTEVTVALEEDREPVRQNPREDAGQGKVISMSGQSSIEKKLDSLQTLLETQLKQQESDSKTGAVKVAETETAEDKNAARTSAQENEKEEEGNAEQDRFVRLLYNTMIENEVDEKYANQILDDVNKTRKPNMPLDYILANIYQKIILKFGKSEGITPAQKGPRIVFFIGPTGVGKTTTIAKIASAYTIEEKRKTALFTTDTYRIAAAEQLRTYAQIMEVPFRIIYSTEEFREAVECFQDYDYIFVDTAGHSHQNEEQLKNMQEVLEQVGEHSGIQTFLVLSATTKYKDLLKIADNYRKITEYQLIFTKLDETATLGNLLNLKLYTDTPIAYITCGQNVPNDIEKFNPQKTVKQLLGGKA